MRLQIGTQLPIDKAHGLFYNVLNSKRIRLINFKR